MIVGLELAPREEVIRWAGKLIEDHPAHRVIVATHCYQGKKGLAKCGENFPKMNGKSSQYLWDELIKVHSNVFMVLSGHKVNSAFNVRKREGSSNNPVYEILTDYTDETKKFKGHFNLQHGQGWLRTLAFYPQQNKIEVKAISVRGRTKLTGYDKKKGDRYPSDPKVMPHTYTIKGYDMQGSQRDLHSVSVAPKPKRVLAFTEKKGK